jgi:hypothetical protein
LGPAGEGALRFHYLDCHPGKIEQEEFLPTFGAAVSEALGKREAEREGRVVGDVV